MCRSMTVCIVELRFPPEGWLDEMGGFNVAASHQLMDSSRDPAAGSSKNARTGMSIENAASKTARQISKTELFVIFCNGVLTTSARLNWRQQWITFGGHGINSHACYPIIPKPLSNDG